MAVNKKPDWSGAETEDLLTGARWLIKAEALMRELLNNRTKGLQAGDTVHPNSPEILDAELSLDGHFYGAEWQLLGPGEVFSLSSGLNGAKGIALAYENVEPPTLDCHPDFSNLLMQHPGWVLLGVGDTDPQPIDRPLGLMQGDTIPAHCWCDEHHHLFHRIAVGVIQELIKRGRHGDI